MEDKIIDLISLLSIENDSELIECLYSKLFEIQTENDKQKDYSYKYSLKKFSNTREMSTLYMGLKKSINHGYKSNEYEKAQKLDNHTYSHLCCHCTQSDCEKCIFKKRIEYITSIIENHDKIKKQFIQNLDSDFILNKYLVNKIIVKLNNLKNKQNETSKQ